MIYDHINQAEKYYSLHPLFKTAFEYILKNDNTKLQSGKHELIEDKLFVLINTYFSKSIDDSFSESHKKYIDIQLVISGKERMGFGHFDNFAHEQYDSEKDLQKHSGKLNFVDVEKNHFTVFFPHDIHMPGLLIDKPEEVIKIVVKVAVE